MSEDDDGKNAAGPQSFGQRYGLAIMMLVMLALFVLVIVVQTMK